MPPVPDLAATPVVIRRPRRRVCAAALSVVARRERLLFALLLVVQLIPVWAFTYLPTTDGPAHVASADVMRRYNDPAAPDNFRKYYYVAKPPRPKMAGPVVQASMLAAGDKQQLAQPA